MKLHGLAPDFVKSEDVFHIDTLKYVKLDLLSNSLLNLGAAGKIYTVKAFGVERAKKLLHGSVVIRAVKAWTWKTESGILGSDQSMLARCIESPGRCGVQV